MSSYRKHTRSLLLGATALVGSLALAATPAGAQERQYDFDVPAQPLESAVQAFARQAQQQVIFADTQMRGMTAPRLSGSYSADEGLAILLAGTGLEVRRTASGVLKIAADADPQSSGAAGGGAEVEALIVTAQKREEDIQDVPIAISAFTQEALERSQIAGGPDLMTQVPNMTFTKTNFSSYSIQIRGIGTQAISATTDPAVAVAFNNAPILRNRFFEQEFYDLQRVEVLRGPQGTLYGRNATAGVVNLLTARPRHQFEARLSGDIANYSSARLEGMVNLPIVEDVVALRLAGAWTKRQGFVTNEMTGQQIDGRDLWSTRLTLGFEPTDAVSAYLTWEHFQEDDDRLRSGKQLCKTDELPTQIGSVPYAPDTSGQDFVSYLSQGCEGASLYDASSFQVPNGYALPYWGGIFRLQLPNARSNPYASATQSRDLRVIESSFEPTYRAKADIGQLQFNIDLSPNLGLTSETTYVSDFVFASQDYNRFTTLPGAFTQTTSTGGPNVLNNGVFCDPQLGCSDRLLLGDLSYSRSTQFSQEFRVSSAFEGPVNFNLGLNFLRHDTMDKYYVFANTLSLLSAQFGASYSQDSSLHPYEPGVTTNAQCLERLHASPVGGDPALIQQTPSCVYMDPNPIDSPNDLGHNYFLSKNPYRLISYAAFGELYYNVTPSLKLTAGLRFTVDKKHAPEVNSWLLATRTVGYPVNTILDQEWREPTGRLVLDWKPDLGFTDESLFYSSYAHGYKAGGANPPRPVVVTFGTIGVSEALRESFLNHPKSFEPEFVDAYELGTKNTVLDGAMTLNANVFYYDYKDYQISEIVNRAAVNRNFDAEIWGAELEVDWRPIENLRFGFKRGWERTRVADGEEVIDLIDRTAGDPDYIVIKAFATIPSNCIVPVSWLEGFLTAPTTGETLDQACLSYYGGTPFPGLADTPNNGEGIAKDLGGNELPNAPEFTTTFTVDYTLPLMNDWLVNLHADLYRQSQAWTRIINNDPYDRLKPYETVNLAAIFTNEDAGWKVMAYVKNVFDTDSITGSFLNSDDTGLTTNVFLTEPRLYGLRVTKEWTGGETTFPDLPIQGRLWLSLGGSVDRVDAPTESYWPAWTSLYRTDFDFPTGAQEEEFDFGDGREFAISYTPPNSRWNVSAALRGGQANLGSRIERAEAAPGGWLYGETLIGIAEDLDPAFAATLRAGEQFITYDDHIVVEEVSREEHQLIDFAVGWDFGSPDAGWFSHRVSLGLRHATFDSSTALVLNGTPDTVVPPEDLQFGFLNGTGVPDPITWSVRQTDIEARRSFEGAGLTVAWDVAARVLGDAAWQVTLDGGVIGSALSGKQETTVAGHEIARYYSWQYNAFGDTYDNDAAPITLAPRRESRIVPALGANLGVTFETDRLKVSTGYRWERFFNVLDGGYAEHEDADRTLDGPYFKLAIGFGG